MRTLFLNYSSTAAFGGGSGDRSPEPPGMRLGWYPVYLARCAAELPESRLIDAVADELGDEQLLLLARGFELCVVHSTRRSLAADLRFIGRLRERHPNMRLGLIGAWAGQRAAAILAAPSAPDFIFPNPPARAVRDLASGRNHRDIPGLAYAVDGREVRNPGKAPSGPEPSGGSLVRVYRRDLTAANYSVSFLRHPYLALDGGGGRAAPAEELLAEASAARAEFPALRELYFDDEQFTADPERVSRLAEGLGRLGLAWSCHADPRVPPRELARWRRDGLRLVTLDLLSGSRPLLEKLGSRFDPPAALRFARECRRLGVRTHANFVFGLPGETQRTIEESLRFLRALPLDSLLLSLAAERAAEPSLLKALFRGYCGFYLRPRNILRVLRSLLRDPDERGRRVGAGKEFLRFLWRGPEASAA